MATKDLASEEAARVRQALRADVPRRIDRMRAGLDANGLDAMLVTKTQNVHYLSGFTGSSAALLVGRRGGKRGVVLVTDFRYEEEVRLSAPGATPVIRKGSMLREALAQARRRGWKKLGYELTGLLAVERDELAREARAVKGKRIALKGLRGAVETLRAVKSLAEAAAIARAVRIAERAARSARAAFASGKTELEIARRLNRRMEDLGAAEPSFPSIVALDARSSLPHAKPGEARPRAGSFLLMDWGARVDGYCSDLTRVHAQNSIPRWLGKMHRTVLAARAAAISRIGPGVRAADVDAAARDVIRRAGFGRRFGHALGHGLGLKVHERPLLAAHSKDVLRPGMVFTVEPGIYVPGRGGVRIEDDVLVTENGAEVLSRLSRELE